MKAIYIVFICGLAATLCAVLLQVLVPKLVENQLKKNLEITPDNSSVRYQQWRFPTIPVTMEFYVFDILNGPLITKGHRPLVKQRGPYVYQEFLYKGNISFDDEKPAVSYMQKQWFIFDRMKSCAGCNPFNDTITTVNMPYVIMAQVASTYSGLAQFVINLMLMDMKEDLLMTKTVQELIWGYNDPLFEEFAQLRKKWGLYFIPEISPFMFLQSNNTYDGEITVNTGAEEMALVATWEKWRGMNNVSLWLTKYANMFNGSDGTQFPPGVTRGERLYFFSPNLCRSIYISFDSQRQVKGIDVLRFTTPPELFQNASGNPENGQFCLHRCYPDGILNGAKDCEPSKTPSPVLISTPHFLIGDPFLREQVVGLSPDREKHGLFLSIEPLTGIPLQALIRLQINLHIRPIPGIIGTEGIRESYVPVMYFSNNATVDDNTAKMMRQDIFLPLKLCFYAEIVLYCLGGVLVVIAVALLGCHLTKRSANKNMSKNGPQNKDSGVQSDNPPPSEKTHLIPKSLSKSP